MYFFISRIMYWVFYNQVVIILVLAFFYLLNKNKKIEFFLRKFLLAYILIVAIFPTGTLMLYSLESKYMHQVNEFKDVDGILVLSGMESTHMTEEHGQFYLKGSQSRIIESIRLQKKHPNARVIFSGGSGDYFSKDVTSSVPKQFYDEFAFDPKMITFESQSTNTYENIINSKTLIKPEVTEKWILITSAFHMNRSINTAANLKWELTPYPVDFKLSKDLFSEILKFNLLENIKHFQIASHEMLGIMIYKLMGRSL